MGIGNGEVKGGFELDGWQTACDRHLSRSGAEETVKTWMVGT